MERLGIETLNSVLDVMGTIEKCCGGFNDSLEIAKYEFLKKLKEYMDLEEHGKLLKLPCAVGDMVYEINKIRGLISEFTVKGFSLSEYGIFIKWTLVDGIYRNLDGFNEEEIGKTIFLTRQEAEAVLKNQNEME